MARQEKDKEAINGLRTFVLDHSAQVFTDAKEQEFLVNSVQNVCGAEAAGDVASRLGMDEKAKELYRAALQAEDHDYSRLQIMKKLGDQQMLTLYWQGKYDSAGSGSEAIEAGQELGLESRVIGMKALQLFSRKEDFQSAASGLGKLGMEKEAADFARQDFAKKEERRDDMLHSWGDSHNAEQCYRHDMSHAINAAVSTGNLEVINEGYAAFMASVAREGKGQYVERLIGHFYRARDEFAKKGITLDAKEFFSYEGSTELIIEACKNDARTDEYGYSTDMVAELYELLGDEASAAPFRERAKEIKAAKGDSDDGEEGYVPGQGNMQKAFVAVKEAGNVEQAKAIYQGAIDEHFAGKVWCHNFRPKDAAEFVGEKEQAKVYDLVSCIK